MKNCVVALTWTLKDAQGELLDTLDDPVEFFVGGGDLLPHIENALLGHRQGDTLDLNLEPEHAFGDYDSQWLFLAPRDGFPEELAEGMTYEFSALPVALPPQAPRDAFYTVTDIYPEHVVLDANHPLAGMALRLHLSVEEVRPATQEENARRSAGTGFFTL